MGSAAVMTCSPVLAGLAAGNLEEQQVGNDASSGLPSGGSKQTWSSCSNVRRHLGGLPEGRDPGRAGGVNAQAPDAYRHALIVARRSGGVQRF